ncbi:MAG: aldo/keto reductase [Pseudomonadota bacterium]|nr:aldo/keto reductase [Pseudomonadota bacterium]
MAARRRRTPFREKPDRDLSLYLFIYNANTRDRWTDSGIVGDRAGYDDLDEIRQGRLRAWGAPNWTTDRLQQAIDYGTRAGRALPVASSPHFSLARANEPYWPDTVVTSAGDLAWFERSGMPLIAWSSLGRGFFAHGDEAHRSDPDLVRVFYSDGNFERKRRAVELGEARGLSLFEIALAWVAIQKFPVVALCGA